MTRRQTPARGGTTYVEATADEAAIGEAAMAGSVDEAVPAFGRFGRASTDPPRRLQPRERLLRRGARSLCGADLLGVVMRGGGRGQLAHDLAAGLVRRHGIAGLARLSPAGWLAEPGLGPGNAVRLAAVFELGRRAWGDAEAPRPKVASAREAWRQVRTIGRLRKEHLVGLYLDAQNGLIHRETITIGSLNTTRTHPREILFPAIEHLALGFILAHNHPSGSLEPSTEDVAFTRGVQRAAELMGIDLYDHLIVTRHGYTSLRERGVL